MACILRVTVKTNKINNNRYPKRKTNSLFVFFNFFVLFCYCGLFFFLGGGGGGWRSMPPNPPDFNLFNFLQFQPLYKAVRHVT